MLPQRWLANKSEMIYRNFIKFHFFLSRLIENRFRAVAWQLDVAIQTVVLNSMRTG